MRVGPTCAALGLAIAVAAPDAWAFRTASDFPEFAGTERVRWAAPVISYVRHGQTPSGLSSSAVTDTLIRAFGAWSKPSCSAVLFDSDGTTSSAAIAEDGRNTVEWKSSGWDSLGAPPDAAGLTDLQYEKGADGIWRIVEADLYFNAQHHSFTLSGTRAGDERDLLSVATHESGHILGLAHPCEIGGADGAPECNSVPGAAETTMYPVYGAEQATLSPDDEEGVCFLYPASACEGGCPSGSVCSPEGCRPACGSAYCTDGEVCHDAVCIPVDAGCGSLGCEPDVRCAADTDCSEGLRCISGACAGGSAALGDPCARHADCAQGSCTAAGHCAGGCSSDAGCDLRPLGAVCSEANQCLGEQCLAGLTEQPVCTRLCGPALSPCPSGWECLEVEGRNVCAPAPKLVPGGGGCAVTRSREGNAGLLLIPLAGFLRRRRRRFNRREVQL